MGRRQQQQQHGARLMEAEARGSLDTARRHHRGEGDSGEKEKEGRKGGGTGGA